VTFEPLISVVVPSYNRRDLLERALDSYESQGGDALRFELVVVDDGSTDGTKELLAARRPRGYALRFDHQRNAGPALARNRALEMAKGELIVFVGDDIVPCPGFLFEHWRAHRQRPERNATFIGRTCWPNDLEVTTTMRHVDGRGAQQFSFYYLRDGGEYDFRHFYTSNLSIKRALLDLEPTHFSRDFQRAAFEDVELSYRLSLHGMRIHYHASALAHHYHPYDAERFFKRQHACGEMAAVLYEKFPILDRWLGVRELDAERLEALHQAPVAWYRNSRLAGRLREMEERALRVAALFRYAYLKGLAEAVYEEGAAGRLCARLYQRLLGPAVVALVKGVSLRDPALPRSDIDAILAYAA
jgi:glycosyltransferase involved in cell wall biosynthesis